MSIHVHHSGVFIKVGHHLHYKNGKTTLIKDIDIDRMSWLELRCMIKEQLGFLKDYKLHHKLPNGSYEIVSTDQHVLKMLEFLTSKSIVEVFMEHLEPGVERPELLPEYCLGDKVEATLKFKEKTPCSGVGGSLMMRGPSKSKRINKTIFTTPQALCQRVKTRQSVRHDKDLDLSIQENCQIVQDPIRQDKLEIGREDLGGHAFFTRKGHESDVPTIHTMHVDKPSSQQRQPEEDNHETTTPRSGHSAVGSGEGLDKSSQPKFVVHDRSKRNFRPKREATRQAERAKRTTDELEVQPRDAPPKKIRGPNLSHKYRPDKLKGEARFPLYWNKNCRPVGPYTEKFGLYLGEESRHTMRYPLHLQWGEFHEESLQRFFVQAQEDYDFLHESAREGSDFQKDIDIPNVLEYIRGKIQDGLRGYRHRVKKDCWDKWNETPEAEREALFQTKHFKGLNRSTWELLCEYFSDPNNLETAKINTNNKAQVRAMYTGGSKTMARAIEAKEKELISQGITPTPLNLYLSTHSSSFDLETETYKYPDAGTKEYCERVVEVAKANGIGIDAGNDPAEFTKALDLIHGIHHGGYERGLGVGPTRRALKRAKVPNVQQTREQRMEETLQAQNKKVERELLAQNERVEAELQVQREKAERLEAELLELKDMVNQGQTRSSVDVSFGSETLMTPDEAVEITCTMLDNKATLDQIKKFMARAFKNKS